MQEGRNNAFSTFPVFLHSLLPLALPKRIDRVRQKSSDHLADSLLAASHFFATDWDENSRETAKCLGARIMGGKRAAHGASLRAK
jgi:hypothetical protein